jgi:hypothetical protein
LAALFGLAVVLDFDQRRSKGGPAPRGPHSARKA